MFSILKSSKLIVENQMKIFNINYKHSNNFKLIWVDLDVFDEMKRIVGLSAAMMNRWELKLLGRNNYKIKKNQNQQLKAAKMNRNKV